MGCLSSPRILRDSNMKYGWDYQVASITRKSWFSCIPWISIQRLNSSCCASFGPPGRMHDISPKGVQCHVNLIPKTGFLKTCPLKRRFESNAILLSALNKSQCHLYSFTKSSIVFARANTVSMDLQYTMSLWLSTTKNRRLTVVIPALYPNFTVQLLYY